MRRHDRVVRGDRRVSRDDHGVPHGDHGVPCDDHGVPHSDHGVPHGDHVVAHDVYVLVPCDGLEHAFLHEVDELQYSEMNKHDRDHGRDGDGFGQRPLQRLR